MRLIDWWNCRTCIDARFAEMWRIIFIWTCSLISYKYTFFIRTVLLEYEVEFCLKFKNKLRTISALTEEQSQIISIQNKYLQLMYCSSWKYRVISKLHSALCLFWIIPASVKEWCLKFQLKNKHLQLMNCSVQRSSKCRAINKLHFALCFLIML